MNSNLFSYFGLENFDPAYIFISMSAIMLILLTLVIIQMVKLSRLRKTYEKFMQGKDAKSMEDEIATLFKDIDSLKTSSEKNKKDIKKIFHNLSICYQKVGLVKYDAFQEMGGQLSFSLALLNENSDGFIINSVHSSDGCYTYTKEIKKGECAISLGEEERKALDKAISSGNSLIAEGKRETATAKQARDKKTDSKSNSRQRTKEVQSDNKKKIPFDVVKELKELENLEES